MCNHLFEYPEDKEKNYNPDGKTLTGICRYCGTKNKALGFRGADDIIEKFNRNIPYGKTLFIDNLRIMW